MDLTALLLWSWTLGVSTGAHVADNIPASTLCVSASYTRWVRDGS